jgi:hypothetical protein
MIAFLLLLIGINPYKVGQCIATPSYIYKIEKEMQFGVVTGRLGGGDKIYFTYSELKYVSRVDCFKR